MIKRIKRNVPYNKPLIVASIIADKLGDNPETAVVTPVISIGFNGTEFVSSTEWLYQNNGVECIYSFNLEPQGATFITLEAGMNFAIDDRKRWSMLRDKKTAFVEALGQKFEFAEGQPLRVAVRLGCKKFPMSDCDVKLLETDKCRIYSLLPDSDTAFGENLSEESGIWSL